MEQVVLPGKCLQLEFRVEQELHLSIEVLRNPRGLEVAAK